MGYTNHVNRRKFLKYSAATGALMGLGPTSQALAAGFPERNINVVIPTAEGGGADRIFRAFTSVWKNYLDVEFEPGFFPGASGRVGYEVYMGKHEPDCYNLIMGNMGPEVLNWAMKKPTFDLKDYFYFGQLDTDPSVVFAGAKSNLKTIDDIIAEGKKRKLNVGTSRMAHPGSIGILALGEATGAQFNLIPLKGGKRTVAGAVTGEVDFSVLTSGTVIAAGDAVNIMLVFDDKNKLGEPLDNAPTMNEKFGTDLPPMLSARAFGIHRAAAEKYPDRFDKLQSTLKQAVEDPAFKDAFIKAKGTPEYINYGGAEDCAKFAASMLELGERFKPLLSGEK